jgi:tRNA U55 pseudouridine synthase TruB
LAALRRTAVGGFALEDAVFADTLQPLTVALKPLPVNTPGAYEMIRESLLPMTPDLAEKCGFVPVHIDKRRLVDFYNGKPIEEQWFSEAEITAKANKALAVFAESGEFAGVVQSTTNVHEFRYGFVVSGGVR